MRYPHVKFKIDPNQDYNNFVLFKRYAEPRFLPLFVPEKLKRLLKGKKTDQIIVRDFVEKEFKAHRKEIQKNVEKTSEQWQKIAPVYFKLMDQIFNQHPWPKGKYIGYTSVFKMFPRDVMDKTFYFSAFDPTHAQKTIAHEMMHFIFFDYLKKHYRLNQESKIPNRGSSYIWNVSEVFNLTIESWAPYQKMFNTHPMPYDAMHKRMLPRMKRLWKKDPNIHQLLKKYF